jgi:hypothetical protein
MDGEELTATGPTLCPTGRRLRGLEFGHGENGSFTMLPEIVIPPRPRPFSNLEGWEDRGV